MELSILVLLTIGLAGLITGRLLSRRKCPSQDYRSVPGLPFFGNAIALGRGGAAYIAACRKQFGDVFMLRVVGQRMMFWFDPTLITRFFSAPESEITFRPAVEQFTQRVFGLPSKAFFPKHIQMLQHLRELLVPSTLASHAAALAVAVEKRMDCLLPHDQQVDLYLVMRRLVFGAGVECLFGASCLLPERISGPEQPPHKTGSQQRAGQSEDKQQVHKDDAASAQHASNMDAAETLHWDARYEEELEAAFYSFEAGFEMAASPVPHVLQPAWCAARKSLLAWLKRCHDNGLTKGSVAGQLVERCNLPDEMAPHLLLAVLWASQANTVAACFWSTAFLTLPNHQQYKQAIMDELRSLGATCSETTATAASVDEKKATAAAQPDAGASLAARAALRAMDRKSTVSRCVAEAIRLRVQSIGVRMAASTFTVATAEGDKVLVPKGTILTLNPFLTHHDTDKYPGFPHAHTYHPQRGVMVLPEPNNLAASQTGLAFGGGFYRCPGRFFAEMEVALSVQLVLAKRSLTLTPQHLQPQQEHATVRATSPASIAGASSAAAVQSSVEPAGLLHRITAVAAQLGLQLIVGMFGDDAAKWGLGVGLDLAGKGTPAQAKQGNPRKLVCDGDVCYWTGGGAGVGAGGEASGEGAMADWLQHSGDPDGLLPDLELRRLVGVKTPARPCWAQVQTAAYNM